MSTHLLDRFLAPVLIFGTIVLAPGRAAHAQAVPEPALTPPPIAVQTPEATPPSIVRKLNGLSERMEMTVNTSRILTLDQKVPQAQVNNPEILQITPLSPNQIQISAKKAGVTQVNLWSDNKQIYTVDVIVQPDARELAEMLKAQFPTASLKVVPVASSVMISGYVDQPEEVNHVIRIAEEYYPKVINNITVSGVQQVLLHVRVMEVSRTKLRRLGFDFAKLTGRNMVASSVSGLLSGSVAASEGKILTDKQTFTTQIIQPGGSFFGVLEALREDKLLKILAEPTLVTISGRPASFLVGGEIPIPVPQSLGTTTIEYKRYGTQLDFVPIVLGNGKVRLEVRPKVSDLDWANAVVVNGSTVPGLKSREVETGVEMNAGQTLAIAGLLQNITESQRHGLPWVSDLPYVGAMFRRMEDQNNEIELLILVTPELVDPLNPHEVPSCGPGMDTASPNDCELYFKGYLEVPRCCPNCGGDGCAECAAGETTATAGNGKPMPGMILGPTTPSKPVPETAAYPKQSNPYRPAKGQGPPSAGDAGQPKPLPGFKGQTGYGTVR
ncbi:MAG: type II and III secretion system protein family protein [Planctomycetia bacterium]|nr:type II and III secretion system protein family protein [Planctomycetia bacterium]